MKVKELIEELSKHNVNLEVYARSYDDRSIEEYKIGEVYADTDILHAKNSHNIVMLGL